MRDRYAPPKAALGDVLPAEPFRIRTRWFYLVVTLVLCGAAVLTLEVLLENASAWTLATSLGLTALLALWPLRQLARLQGASFPLWWNAMTYGVLGLGIASVFLEDYSLYFVAFVPLFILSVIFFVAPWVAEARKGVRVYSTANGFIIEKLE